MAFVLSAFMTMYLRRENARRDREYKRPEEYTVEEKLLERHLGDNASFFRYTVSLQFRHWSYIWMLTYTVLGLIATVLQM